jgi:phosphoribosylglycinamide formyltransferase 1
MQARPPASLRLGVLVSGEGTTLLAIDDAIRQGRLTGTSIALVACDRPHAPAVGRASARGLPVLCFPPSMPPPGSWQDQLSDALASARVDLVVLAGFLRILQPRFLGTWEGRVINIHPSLLPKYAGPGMYGTRVHAAVIAAGERETGATVHVVTPDVDRGPVLAKERWPVLPGETPEALSERQKPLEHELLIRVLQSFAAGSLHLPYRPDRASSGEPSAPAP